MEGDRESNDEIGEIQMTPNENQLTFDLSIQVSKSSFNHGRAKRIQQNKKNLEHGLCNAERDVEFS